MAKRNRVLLAASYSVIEPLGLLHLAGLARDLGWERKIHLVPNHDFESFFEKVKDFKPDVVGFNVYTGNHLQLFQAFEKLKKDHPNIVTVVGGPHPTYFPVESSKHVDYAVMSEGFGSFRQILEGKTSKGILIANKTEPFPHPDRETFYKDYPDHGKSKIKSIISMTGCPYRCTYCYNSSTPEDISVSHEVAQKMAKSLGMGGRLFPHNVRTVEAVLQEGEELRERWPTEVIYFQDDVFGFDEKEDGFLEKLAQRWPSEVNIPFHAQMRWEMTKSDRRLEKIRAAGGFGLTLAIESSNPSIRKEVLSRAMQDELVFEGMEKVIGYGFKVRTEQITGLPYGATSEKTLMNLEADLELLKYNVELKEKTGGPTMGWASTLAPYKGTKLFGYCQKYGYYAGDNDDVPDTFFERSVLKFLKEWIGPKLEQFKNDPEIWLAPEELERYRDQNAELRRKFSFFVEVPKGHILAKNYLANGKTSYSFEQLGKATEIHLKTIEPKLIHKIQEMRDKIPQITSEPHEQKCLFELAPYFGCLPKGELAARRFLKYGQENGELTSIVLSNATRHHLYDEVLYAHEKN
ncbi:MAG: hypothetical protein A2W61_08325 [Deltaproteobacteria bacterium RIFCSPLOWO2_01_44_7]|nr:MAG: hypothetical protein A2712_02285 [Deltaproteobacteria bacterium RIFCSPHIGHO2_01_FULL_43_49]OGQ15047.1 MAG: hypothetical protein A3D22_03195 [Deltaproteobacteria bacterium RIFCSPHIGHO2_02_FULL_44_53]OGQ27334.1 MAG: hypothetical protein A3D98_02880 [Deltaproteobacteria bacterium RIFCSPHIGHO2_12_FULL_44_21]OGQ31564.1 MAG: hypothetical protein A2979_04355 [Deltaproteobacteria bacterium RIFCSPLOWO2_01_FULL_45_74]OGQ42625.1 MAG: hypothetical protein A2W61_08325 [Deltaproteobacteria bacterium 